MAEVFDILLDPDFDLTVINGDFAIGESTQQHQQCLLIAEPGQLRQNPEMGVGVFSFTNEDETLESLKKAIQKNFEADGMSIEHLQVNSTGNIDVTATY